MVYLSNSPRFLRRQEARSACAAVFEHAETETCPCSKCRLAARSRARPGATLQASTSAPGLGVTFAAEEPSAARTPASHRVGLTRGSTALLIAASVSEPLRDFTWLLRTIGTVAVGTDSAEDAARKAQGPGGLGGLFQAIIDSTLQTHLGFRLPDTVVLEKGRPRRRYTLDVLGRLQVSYPKTSADLLRILREFVQRAAKRLHDERLHRELAPLSPARPMAVYDGDAFDGAPSEDDPVTPALTQHFNLTAGSLKLQSTFQATGRSQSAGALGRASSKGRAAAASRRRSSVTALEAATEVATTDVAVLYYGDSNGTVRRMCGREAQVQMTEPDGTPANKLPRAFWQDIRLLQEPVPSREQSRSRRTRHITFKYSAGGGSEPRGLAPLAAIQRQVAPGAGEEVAKLAAEKVAKVPVLLNHFLKTRRHGQPGFGLEITCAYFEFEVEPDGTLWLVGASRIACAQIERAAPPPPAPKVEELKYFDRKEFTRTLQKQHEVFSGLKRRFPDPHREGAAAQEAAVDAKGLNVVDAMPQDLEKFYAVRQRMLGFYEEEILAAGREVGGGQVDDLGSTQALGFFFRRWAEAVARKR